MPTFVAGSGISDDYATFLLPVIDVNWFKRALIGALFEMTVPANWIEMGDVAASFAVEEAAQMIDGYIFMLFNPFPVGLILPFASQTPPAAFLVCDGTEYAVADYPELFAVTGYTYGGADDVFNVPNLLDRVPVGSGDAYTIADFGGEPTHTLSESEIPSHSHTIPLTTSVPVLAPGEIPALVDVPFFSSNTGSTGGDEPHNNMQPFLALNYCIYAGRIG